MFLNPFLLFGLTAVSVPIIIHLLNRRRFQKVVWAAMRFIQNAVEQNQRRMNIEDLILLILRCVIIALIALAVSKPVLSRFANVFGDGVGAVILLDNSASMSQRDGPTSRFEQAKQIADSVLTNLPRGSSVALVLVSDVADPVIGEPTADIDAVRKAIHEATLTDRGSNIVPGMKKAVEILSGRGTLRREIYTITDSQGLAWRQTADVQKLIEENKREITTTLIFAGDMATRNLAVTDLRVNSEIAAVNQPLRFIAQVTNFGTSVAKDVDVSIRVDKDAAVVNKANLGDLQSGESKSVLLSAKFAKDGYHTVTAMVPNDVIPADDQRSLAFHVVKQVQVLLVDGEPGREARDAKTFFLSQAVQPVDPKFRETYHVQQRTVTAQALDSSVHLDDYSVIMLANVAELPASQLPALERFVKNGGGLVVFPGANANAAFYNQQLFKSRALLPASLGNARGDAEKRTQFWTFQTKDFTHPIVDIWAKAGRGNPASARFYRVYDLLPPSDRNKATPPADVSVGEPRLVMSYNDGKPAIMERTWGMGRVIMFSSGADTAWNNLPARADVFLPLISRILGSLVGREDEFLNIRAGEQLAVPQPSELLQRDVLIQPPGDEKAPASSTRIELAGNVPMLKFDRTDRAGVYTASIGERTLKFVAGGNTEEPAIDPVSPQQMRDLQNSGASIVKWQSGMQIDDAIKRSQSGTELWWPLAIIALILAATETYLAHVFSRPK